MSSCVSSDCHSVNAYTSIGGGISEEVDLYCYR